MDDEIRVELARTKTAAAAMALALQTEGYAVSAPESCQRVQVSDASAPDDPPLVDYAADPGKAVWMVVARR